jgi:hypothetical protein
MLKINGNKGIFFVCFEQAKDKNFLGLLNGWHLKCLPGAIDCSLNFYMQNICFTFAIVNK